MQFEVIINVLVLALSASFEYLRYGLLFRCGDRFYSQILTYEIDPRAVSVKVIILDDE